MPVGSARTQTQKGLSTNTLDANTRQKLTFDALPSESEVSDFGKKFLNMAHVKPKRPVADPQYSS
jgi:hypothetical protein